MWPNIFGPGWVWGTMVALTFMCFILGVLGFLLIVIKRPPAIADASVDRLFHRLEEGDMTPKEFERLKGSGQRQPPVTEYQQVNRR